MLSREHELLREQLAQCEANLTECIRKGSTLNGEVESLTKCSIELTKMRVDLAMRLESTYDPHQALKANWERELGRLTPYFEFYTLNKFGQMRFIPWKTSAQVIANNIFGNMLTWEDVQAEDLFPQNLQQTTFRATVTAVVTFSDGTVWKKCTGERTREKKADDKDDKWRDNLRKAAISLAKVQALSRFGRVFRIPTEQEIDSFYVIEKSFDNGKEKGKGYLNIAAQESPSTASPTTNTATTTTGNVSEIEMIGRAMQEHDHTHNKKAKFIQ
jgi:hypothetical protein